MKTVKEWLEELPEPYRSQALENYEKHPIQESRTRLVVSKEEAVLYGFEWELTPQKWTYWNDYYESFFPKPKQPKSPTPTERQTAEALLKEFGEWFNKDKRLLIHEGAINDFLNDKYGKG